MTDFLNLNILEQVAPMADPESEKIIDLFFFKMDQKFDDLSQAIQTREIQKVHDLAHGGVGYSKFLGMTSVAGALQSLVVLAKSGSLAGAENHLHLARAEIERSKIFIEQWKRKRSEPLRILIADDDALVRRALRRFLSTESTAGICIEAADGLEALLKARESQPELILLDVIMPRLGGFDAARELRKEFPHAKIFLLSGQDPENIRSLALQAGADDCLDKACFAEKLLPIIKTLLLNRSDTLKQRAGSTAMGNSRGSGA